MQLVRNSYTGIIWIQQVSLNPKLVRVDYIDVFPSFSSIITNLIPIKNKFYKNSKMLIDVVRCLSKGWS